MKFFLFFFPFLSFPFPFSFSFSFSFSFDPLVFSLFYLASRKKVDAGKDKDERPIAKA